MVFPDKRRRTDPCIHTKFRKAFTLHTRRVSFFQARKVKSTYRAMWAFVGDGIVVPSGIVPEHESQGGVTRAIFGKP
jgi:hypothetical protein